MKTLRSRIRTPFLLLFLGVLLIMHGLFNLAMHLYMDAHAKADLRGAVLAAEPVVESSVSKQLLSLTGSRLQDAFARVEASLSASAARSIHILYFNRKQQLVYPAETDGAALILLAEQLNERLLSFESDTVYTTRAGAKKYYLLYYPMTELSGPRPALVFAAESDDGAMLLAINAILFLLILAGAGTVLYVSGRVSSRLARPVTKLYDVARRIGSGEFNAAEIHEETGIRELDDLYTSIGEMSSRLAESDRAQKTFIQNAAHELRTPLMSIRGYAEAVSAGVAISPEKAASVIVSESRKLEELLGGLLTLSRLESPVFETELAPLCLGGILQDELQRLGGVAAKQEKELVLSLPEEEIMIYANETLLSQVVMNIVSNGLRHALSKVEITLTAEGDYALIRIADDGDGIAKEDMNHLFERFYKGSKGNFGLGLTIAKTAAERMGGGITAFNGEKGAVFEIKLPLLR